MATEGEDRTTELLMSFVLSYIILAGAANIGSIIQGVGEIIPG